MGEWQHYVEWAYSEDRQEKRKVLVFIAGIVLLVGGGFWLLVRDEGGAIAFAVLFAVVLLVALVSEVLPRLARRRDRRGAGEVAVGEAVAYINGSVHCWTLPGSRLEGVEYVERPFPVVKIHYSYLMMAGRSLYFFRNFVTAVIPVPRGGKDEADLLVGILQEKARSLWP